MINDETLYVQDLVFREPVDLHQIIAVIPERYSKVVLQFCPDNFYNLNYKPIKTVPEDFVMVTENFNLGLLPIRFPETGRC